MLEHTSSKGLVAKKAEAHGSARLIRIHGAMMKEAESEWGMKPGVRNQGSRDASVLLREAVRRPSKFVCASGVAAGNYTELAGKR